MKKNIAIVGGGNSSEHKISMLSAHNVLDNIDRKRYNPYLIELDDKKWNVLNEDVKLDFETFSICTNKQKIKIDYVFNVFHGTPGEDGSFAGYLNLLNIPHSTGSVLSTSLSFNKCKCNQYLSSFGIQTPPFLCINNKNEIDFKQIEKKIKFPCIVKPSESGSSFGISKVYNVKELQQAINYAIEESKEVIIEEFISGIELSCGILKTKKEEFILPVTEICYPGEFWDYHHKYFSAKTKEITPARISTILAIKIQNICSKVYDLLDCRGIVRLDFMLQGENIYFLELNSIPGITKMSILTNAIKSTKWTLKDLFTKIIEDC